MNDYVCIGKIVNTHGIKGEIRILSDFEYKDKVFALNNILYIGNNKIPLTILSYRHHKMFDMVFLKGINNINDVLKYKGSLVYFLRDDLNLKNEEYLISDLIGCEIMFEGKNIGKIIDIFDNSGNILIQVKGTNDFKIPLCEEYIEKVNTKDKVVYVKNVKGLIL